MIDRIGVLPLARATFDVAYAEETKERALRRLEEEGFVLAGPRALLMDADSVERGLQYLEDFAIDLLLVLQITFTDAKMSIWIAKAARAPLGFWAFPEPRTGGRLRLNAFCGLNLASHALGRRGLDAGFLYAPPDAPQVKEALAAMTRLTSQDGGSFHEPSPDFAWPAADAAAQKAIDRLKTARIGVIGERPEGFDTCDYDPDALRRLTGVETQSVALTDLFDRARAIPEERAAATRADVAGRLAGLDDVDQEQLGRSLRLKEALSDLARDLKFDGLAVRCWPETFVEFGCAACAPMAMMNEAGVPAACEADVYGTVTALMLQEIAGAPAFLVDLVDLDAASDTGVIWHCGLAPLSMADPDEPPRATIHSNRRMPLLHEFALKPGRVTFARISQAKGVPKLVLAGGEMLKAPKSFSGTSGAVRFDRPAGEVMERLLKEGIEHHTAFVYGEHRATLRALSGKLNLPVLELT